MENISLNKIGYAVNGKDKIRVPMRNINNVKAFSNHTIDDFYLSECLFVAKNQRAKVMGIQYRNQPDPIIYIQLSVKVSNYTNLYLESTDEIREVMDDLEACRLFMAKLIQGKL